MTARDFFWRPDGVLRAPWRLVGYVIVAYAAFLAVAWVVALSLPMLFRIERTAVLYVILLAALAIAHVVMVRGVDRHGWSTVGLGRAQGAPRRLAVGFALGALCIGVPSLGLLGVHWLRVEPTDGGVAAWGTNAMVFAAFFLPQSLAEEMLVRGYPFAVLRESFGWPAALVATSLVFGGLHAANPGADAQSVLLVTLAGFFLGTVLLVTESLWAAWMAHFAWNWTMAAVLHTAVSGIAMARHAPDYRVVDAGPDWATGGAWGPEGGAGAAIGMLAGIALLVLWRRTRTHAGHHDLQPEAGTAWLNASR